MVAGDFNGDGRLDLAALHRLGDPASGRSVWVFPGNGDGTFAPPIADEMPYSRRLRSTVPLIAATSTAMAGPT